MEICDLYNVDPRIANLVRKDIDNYYKNFNQISLFTKKKVLSTVVFNQLEACMYKEFIDSFELLSKLDISIVR